MSSNAAKIKKKKAKAKIKELKAKAKIEKAKKAPTYNIKESQVYIDKKPEKKQVWYRDPGWIRAIIAIVSLIIGVIGLLFTVF